MKKQSLTFVLLILYTLTMSGCSYEVFQRKFVRKKKKNISPSPIYHVQPFVKPSNIDIYKHAFLFWKTWETELLIALSPSGYPRVVNKLKVKECLEQAINNLEQMKACLSQSKAQELGVYLKTLQEFNALFAKDDVSQTTLERIRHDIVIHKRNVEIRFSFSAVVKDISQVEAKTEK